MKIISLTLNQNFGILQACQMVFDPNANLIPIKGEVGAGKTSLQKALQLGTQGSKTLIDNNLYQAIDTEVQLLDGEIPVFIGCKGKNNKLKYTIYTKGKDGKKQENPVIDGVKATPKKYLELLQTELTWNSKQLTSENPSVQKKILLQLYQKQLEQCGVVFDKTDKDYEGSILHQIEKAEQERSIADAMRKQFGGIAEDLKANGYDVNRPETLPEPVDLSEIDVKIKEKEKELYKIENAGEDAKKLKLSEIKQKAINLLLSAKSYNKIATEKYEKAVNLQQTEIEAFRLINEERQQQITEANEYLEGLQGLGYEGDEVAEFIKNLPQPEQGPEWEKIEKPVCFKIEKDKLISTPETEHLPIIKNMLKYKAEYQQILNEGLQVDKSAVKKINAEIDVLNQSKNQGVEINKTCQAVDLFFEWQKHNDKVQSLKVKYERMLADIDTGVKGLKIVVENENLFLMYNGEYNIDFFNNHKKEYRKISSYSSTQRPIIVMLIQNHLLNQKPKPLRYIFIDDVPTDKKTIELLKTIGKQLDLTIFVSITGDFEKAELNPGEYLIEGGEIFFN